MCAHACVRACTCACTAAGAAGGRHAEEASRARARWAYDSDDDYGENLHYIYDYYRRRVAHARRTATGSDAWT